MKNRKRVGIGLLITLFATMAFSQELTQTVRGTVIDSDSKLPLTGASVVIVGADPPSGATTDQTGMFRLENIPIGRITLEISFAGYENIIVPDIIVNSGKEVILDLSMQETTVTMEEVVIKANKNKGEAINDMALVSSRSISAEDTKRFAGGWDDPSVVLTNFSGVANTRDGNNNIIVRGNAPKYVQWRLEGVEIPILTHQADQNSSGGGLGLLNNKLLASSDFYTGAFSPEFGDVLSGVYDVKLKSGNNEKFESVAGVGLMGIDYTVEGPLKKGHAGSFILNYRYSTIGLLQDVGLINFPNVSTTFQDAAFKVVLPTEKKGTFSFFGLGGLDDLSVKDVKPVMWQTPGDRGMKPEITENFVKNNFVGNLGMNHTFSLNSNSYLKTTLAYSGTGMTDEVYEDRTLNYRSRIKTTTYRGAMTFSNKINAKNKIQIGSAYSLMNENNRQSQLSNDLATRDILVDFEGNVPALRNFISWKHNLNNDIDLVTGFHTMNVLLNDKNTLEPRIAVNWKLNSLNSVHAGYGKHSAMERIHNYFTKVKQPDGTFTEPNKNLDLLKANHYVLGYDRITETLSSKVEIYYQDLYNLPVENDETSYYATINEDTDFRYVPLVNKGVGKNYGLEITLERFFRDNYYFLINGSLFDSKYKSLEGVWRNTKYNSNYLVNILCGKEFDKIGKKKNQTLTVNAKAFFSGGQKYIPLLRDDNGNLAVDPANNKFWDYKKAYEKSLDRIYGVDLSLSYKFNNRLATHEIFLDLTNIINGKARLTEYYDASKPNSIDYVRQMIFLPNLMYRAYF